MMTNEESLTDTINTISITDPTNDNITTNTIHLNQNQPNNINHLSSPPSSASSSSRSISDTKDDPRNLYVDNLPSLSDVELRNLFLPYGAILKSRVVIDPVTRTCAGYGFVMFEKIEDAAKAISGLNQHTLGTKKLRVTIKRSKDRTNHSDQQNSSNNIHLNDKHSNGKTSNQSTPHLSPDSTSHSLINQQSSSQNDTISSNIKSNTNLYVAGIPVTWMKSDIDNLFQTFGHIVDSRALIDRSTGRNRGKAMVRLSTIDECDAAIKSLHQRFIPPQLTQPITVQYASSKESQQLNRPTKISPGKHSGDSSQSSDSSNMSHQSLPNGSNQHSHPRSTAYDSGSPSSHRSSSPMSYHSHSSARYAYHVPPVEMNGVGRHASSPVKMKHIMPNPEYSAIGMTAFHTAPLPPSAYTHAHPSLVASTSPYLMSPHQASSVYGIPSPSSAHYHPSMMHPSYLEQQHPHAQFTQHQHHQSQQTMHPRSHVASPASSVRFHPSMNGRTDSPNEPFNLTSMISTRASASLYVYGLPSAITEADLERLFAIYGGVSSVRLMKHESGAPRGFAFVNMNSVQEAENAIHYLDQFPLGGRILQVQFKAAQHQQKQVPSQLSDASSSENVLQ